jgi:hypothetical protein
MPQATVQQLSEKEFALLVDGVQIGTSKTDCDARFHMHFLNGLFEGTAPRPLDVFTLMNAMEQLGYRPHPNPGMTHPSKYQELTDFINRWASRTSTTFDNNAVCDCSHTALEHGSEGRCYHVDRPYALAAIRCRCNKFNAVSQ